MDKILAKLATRDDFPYGELKLPGKEQALAELAAAGLVEVRKVGRAKLVSLTAAGKARAAALPKAAPTVEERLARIEASLARIEALLAPPAPAVELKPLLLDVVAELDAAHRYGGLVPLPELRRALRGRGVTASDAAVNAALEELEQDFVIDLSIAQSPTTVPDRAAGIERPGRGLVYYVVRRHN
jgi:DNA-binding MarR family transcriptional regulator